MSDMALYARLKAESRQAARELEREKQIVRVKTKAVIRPAGYVTIQAWAFVSTRYDQPGEWYEVKAWVRRRDAKHSYVWCRKPPKVGDHKAFWSCVKRRSLKAKWQIVYAMPSAGTVRLDHCYDRHGVNIVDD